MKLDSALELKARLLSRSGLAARSAIRTRTLDATGTPAAGARTTTPSSLTQVAIGVTGKNGKYRIAVRVQSQAPDAAGVLARVHDMARGETDVRLVGKVRKQAVPWHQRRNRPLRIGGSVGHVDVSAGTLGCFVTRDGSEDLILSNNHVLANEDRGRKGDPIIQPGDADDGNVAADQIGELFDFKKLKQNHNLVDCALARLTAGVEYFHNELDQVGQIRGVRKDLLEEGETVYKVGRTTGYEKGRVTAIEIDRLEVEFDRGDLGFDRQFEIEPAGSRPFSLGGDSGSLIVDSNRLAVGLLFAGNDIDATYANDIHEVLKALKVQLVF